MSSFNENRIYPTVIAYYYPGFHPTPENDELLYPGWTEWDMVRAAKPHYDGHYQPRLPLWGYEDESVPEVMAKKIATAAAHGISVFHFVWYWYDRCPFMAGALNNGFLSANCSDVRFALLWANHDRYDGFPEPSEGPLKKLYETDYTSKSFEMLSDYWIEHYFSHPLYWRLSDGKLFVSIHLPSELIERAGGVSGCQWFIEILRQKVWMAGLGELHINTTQGHYFGDLSQLAPLGFDSVTNYCVLGYCESKDDPLCTRLHLPDYSSLRHLPYAGHVDHIVETWEYVRQATGLPYFPVVTVGRDCTSRVDGIPGEEYVGRYGNRPILDDATPHHFQQSMRAAVRFASDHISTQEPLVFVNSWNEWTEGAYLEPDERYGYGHLEALRQIVQHPISDI